MYNLLINWIGVLIILTILIREFRKIFVRYTLMNKYKSCIDLYNHFLGEAYQIIYKDQLLPFSTSGVVPQGDELETSKRNFIKMSFQLMGTEVLNLLVQFYGSRDILITNMLTYFQGKVDDDEVMKLLNNIESEKEEG